jgi:hypothetical protein
VLDDEDPTEVTQTFKLKEAVNMRYSKLKNFPLFSFITFVIYLLIGLLYKTWL